MLIGLGGGSCAGKTTLAKALLKIESSATRLCFDDYYRDLSHITPEERAAVNYDHPDALDIELFVAHLDGLAAGKSVEVPEYDMATHTRPGGSYRVEAAPVVVVDGILLLALNECRKRLDLKVFVDAPREIRLARRLVRDVEERGREAANVEKQFITSVEPMHDSLVLPSSQYADLRFDHPFDEQSAAQIVLEEMNKI
ncbi:MAG: uridine kinase [Acidimicrobiales bacterium]|nr:uridine kinase [Acidimicrobiales bacterium]